ncbi:MAG: lytic transglycosylase domain-containing protein, partial [Candidatus Binatia bacterium]
PLTEPEVEAFTQHLNQWDAFVTFVVKELGQRTLREETREALLTALLEARYEILHALGAPKRGEDPVRRLFVSSWENLRPIADEIARELPGGEALRLVTFLAAGDALVAFDDIGPSFGVEVSADGLRRMARMVGPTAPEDPLEYTPYVDPRLRFFLGFGSPLEAEEPAPSGSRWPWPSRAWAAAAGGESRWKGWILSDRSAVGEYLGKVGKLIREVAEAKVQSEDLDGARAALLTRLVPAVAWQESCWRQFHERKGTITYLRSSRGSVGILQINERVWRGFYETDELRWNIEYNARAGADILLRYLAIVLRKEAELSDGAIPATARAVYAAYNGGPGQLRRYRSGKASKRLLQVIDGLFGQKFDTSPKDMEAEIARCLVGG